MWPIEADAVVSVEGEDLSNWIRRGLHMFLHSFMVMLRSRFLGKKAPSEQQSRAKQNCHNDEISTSDSWPNSIRAKDCQIFMAKHLCSMARPHL